MIGIEAVPDPSEISDPFEQGLMLPIPGTRSNTVVFEPRDGNEIVHLSAKAVTFHVNNAVAFRLRDVKVDVAITDARVTVACSKYDKGGGWVGGLGGMLVLNAGSKALAAMRRHGKMAVGQVRYPCVHAVGSTTRQGFGSHERLVIDAKADANTHTRLTLLLPNNVAGARAAAEVAKRTARYRLAADPELTDEARAGLEALLTAEPLAPPAGAEKNAIQFHRPPTFWFTTEKAARLVPRAADASAAEEPADPAGAASEASPAGAAEA